MMRLCIKCETTVVPATTNNPHPRDRGVETDFTTYTNTIADGVARPLSWIHDDCLKVDLSDVSKTDRNGLRWQYRILRQNGHDRLHARVYTIHCLKDAHRVRSAS